MEHTGEKNAKLCGVEGKNNQSPSHCVCVLPHGGLFSALGVANSVGPNEERIASVPPVPSSASLKWSWVTDKGREDGTAEDGTDSAPGDSASSSALGGVSGGGRGGVSGTGPFAISLTRSISVIKRFSSSAAECWALSSSRLQLCHQASCQ